MKDTPVTGEFWMALSRRPSSRNRLNLPRLTRGKIGLSGNEIGVKLNLSLPEDAFAKPMITIECKIPESAILHPEVVVMIDAMDDMELATIQAHIYAVRGARKSGEGE